MDENLQNAIAAHKSGDLERAEQQYLEIIKHNPEHLAAMNAYCALLVQLERFAEAEKIISRAIDISNSKQDASITALYNSRGNLFKRMQKPDSAIKDFKAALEINPNYIAAANNIGTCYLIQGDIEQAISSYQHAAKLDPQNPTNYLNLSIALIKSSKIEDARLALKQALEIAPDFSIAQKQLAEIELETKNFADARDYFIKYCANNPDDTATELALSQCYIETAEYAKAETILKKIQDIDPNNADVNYLIATAYMHQSKYQDAMQHYHKQIELAPHLESYYNVGVLYMLQNRFKEAIHYFLEALLYNPDYLDAHMNLASIYLKRQEYEKARNHYYKAEALDPNNPEIKHILSSITQENMAEKAPDEYVTHLFDQYAASYDAQLVKHLKFKVPELIATAVTNCIHPNSNSIDILDLGCGSGLCGERLKQFAKKLDGVDLSSKMLEQAETKNIYDRLSANDAAQYLKQHNNEYDLIVSGDVLPYIGNLEPIFKYAHSCLKPNGSFAFTVERNTESEDFILQKSIRYAHRRDYIENLAAKLGWQVMQIENAVLREQMKQPIDGYCVLLSKKS